LFWCKPRLSFTNEINGPLVAIAIELDPDQVAKVFPGLVVTNEEGEREVAYEGLVGLLIEAVRELDGRVSALEQES